ncbi:ketoacyl-ACP synthase III [bacterium]|nr:ketoacyl-ACP synthase III [bacterium]
MSNSIIKNMKIAGISVVLGENKKNFINEPEYYNNDEKQLAKLKKMIGFDTRYWANPQTTTADLCQEATKKLIKEMNINISNIDAIISVTQTPDYYMPGNAHVIHRNLGFEKDTLAMDLEFGCSGYIYGLWTAGMMLNSGLKRILLLAGDTLSKVANKKDRTEAPLFGDTGSATIIEFDEKAKESYFILKSNGVGIENMLQPAGAYRNPSTEETRKEVADAEGNIRTQENIYMNGFEIFNFTLTEQPKLLNEILKFADKTKEEIDYFILHQANVYIVETILKKAGIPFEKAPSRIFEKYGNQNSASIPSAICSDLSECFKDKDKQALLQGFGIGLSWGACITNLNNTICIKPETFKGE